MWQKVTLKTILSVYMISFNQTNVTQSLTKVFTRHLGRLQMGCILSRACRQICLRQSLWAAFIVSEEKQEFPWCESSDLF